MKKHNKCALGLVAATLSIVALGGCSKVYASNTGAVVTYTDANGNRVSYTAEELFGSYRDSSSSLATEFDKVYEVLVRKYYDTIGGSELESCQATASQNVAADKQTARKNAEDNGTSYEEEWESVLDSHSVDNVDELYEYYLYQAESEDFSSEMTLTFGTRDSSVSGYEAMRDGTYTYNGETVETFKASDWGKSNDGYLKEEMPYHVRHILIKNASGEDKEYTQDKLSATEATKISSAIQGLAGVRITGSGENQSLSPVANRLSFGELAQSFSEDTASAGSFGEGDILTKETEYINEYKLGIYAYESLYNERTLDTTYGQENVYRITPGLTEDATYENPTVDESLFVRDPSTNENVTVNKFFQDEGIGQIPFGAALALADFANVDTDTNGNYVNEGNDTFYPRNVLWNKYFNKHQICVITPNAIESNIQNNSYNYKIASWADENTITAATNAANTYNTDTTTISENWKGVYSEQFGSLPGFSVDTTNILSGDDFAHNVLTDSEGHVVLAVRGGSGTSYQGIFFIVVQRSALSQYGLVASTDESGITTYEESTTSAKNETTGVYSEDRADINDYYNVYIPSESNYPTVTGGADLSTIINYNRGDESDQIEKRDSLVSSISSYNDDLNTYNFQWLYEKDQLEFADEDLKETLMTYSQTKRQSTSTTAFETWSDAWKEYAESIASQEAARNEDGDPYRRGYLITERAAVEYLVPQGEKGAIWQQGGACYYDAQ